MSATITHCGLHRGNREHSKPWENVEEREITLIQRFLLHTSPLNPSEHRGLETGKLPQIKNETKKEERWKPVVKVFNPGSLAWSLTSPNTFPVPDLGSCSMREALLRCKHGIYFDISLWRPNLIVGCTCALSEASGFAFLTIQKRMLWLECCGVNSGDCLSQCWVLAGVVQGTR